MNVRGDTRIAKGTYQNRIEIAFQHGEATGRDSDAVRQITICAPVKLRDFDVGATSSNDLDRFRDDFFADAVSGNNGDTFLQAHDGKGNTVRARIA